MTTDLEKRATRDGFGKALLEVGDDPRIIVLGIDLSEATKTKKFREKYPHRFCEVGIQEQNAVGMAAGMALEGLRPVVPSFGAFLTGRAYEQLLISAGYNRAGILVVGTHSGLAIGKDGTTQMGITDINVMRGIPGIQIFQPADAREAEQITHYLARNNQLAYLRLSRTPQPQILPKDYNFIFNKATALKEGKDLVFFATGDSVYNSFVAAEELERFGVNASVINVSTLKPVDEQTIFQYANCSKVIVTVEDHSIIGGLGSIVSEVVAKEGIGKKVLKIGINDCYGESGDPKDLYRKYGLDSEGIIRATKKFYCD
ncbi:MAG: transketolase C-terminal domain-containing protein [Candidatus Pacearchaeota archaeon]